MTARSRLVLAVCAVALAAACGGSNDSSPSSTPSLSGSWTGSQLDTVAGLGTLTAIISQNGTSISGTYSLSFPSLPAVNNNGTLSGTISGTSVTMTATPTNPLICPALDTGTVNAAGTQITGTYAGVSSCALAHQSGTFTATKQ